MSNDSSVQLIYWPQSQVCGECKHGRLVYDDENPCTYICLKNKTSNERGKCKSKEGGDQDK